MKKTILLAFLFSLILSCTNETSDPVTIGDFTFSSNEVTQNEPFTITYNGDGTMEDSFFYNIQHTKALPQDIDFVNNTATLTIPDSITGVAFNFMVDGAFDQNDKKGFLFKVKDDTGNLVTGAEASINYYAMTYGEQFELASDATELLTAVDNLLTSHPDLVEDWYQGHVFAASQVSKEKVKEVGEGYIAKFSSEEMTIEDYEMLSNVYNAMRDRKKSDSLMTVIVDKFPDSPLALRPKVNQFAQTKDLKAKADIFSQNKEQFLESNYANYMVRSLAMGYKQEGNQAAFDEMMTLIKKKTDKASMLNSMAWSDAEKGQDLEQAAKLSKQSLDLIEAEQKALTEKPEYYTINQYKNSLTSSYNMYADTYAFTLFQKGDVKQAIKYQEIAVSKNANPEMTERYIEYLMKDQQYDKVKEKASTFIEEGNSTAQLKAYFKEAYAKTDAKADVEGIIASLENKAKDKEMEKIRKSLLDEDAIDFTLKNLDGEEVTLSSLKGKTVVLDFWATWCGPCIASFPGMQKVVEKYKDDESVAFFFVDTFEDGEDRLDKVAKFIKDKKYDFHVLIDPKKEDGNDYEVAKSYNITGIPTKIIIGPSGKVKFKSVGYSGSTEKIVSEIDAMVAVLKSTP